jgi:RNA polymerase sigma factor (sigma-70 family)
MSASKGNESASEFKVLLNRIRGGSTEAAWELIERYWPHIHRVVHRMLNSRMRSNFDSDDFIQMVWLSFFREPADIQSFESPDEIVGYLVRMARNKYLDEKRHVTNQKYDVTRTFSMNDSVFDSQSFPSPLPQPSQVALVRERWNRLLADQPSHYKEIARMRLMGSKTQEIAAKVNVDERSVRKIIERMESISAW